MFIADLHIHSKYSRATSKDCVPEVLDFWARRKGLDLIGTGDFTHPAWREELKAKLVPSGDGLYRLKDDFRQEDHLSGSERRPHFIISSEISSIYKKNGKVRKVHNLILLPSLELAESVSLRLEAIGNLHSDGRPILGLDSKDLLEIVLELCPEAIFIPAHIWTPHFSLYGAYSGFDEITECFEDLTSHIYALETGLSSDPPMNWRLSALDDFVLVSNSDAHSPANLGREANIFATELAYPAILKALKERKTKEFYGTIEFFPEKGKYHYDGHRACKVCWKPAETKAADGICPVCGGRITVGVLHRVEELADREEGFVSPFARPFESLVPFNEVIAASMGYTTASMKVKEKYDDLLLNLGPELFILREAGLDDIRLVAGPAIAEGIRRLRSGQLEIRPGFDGEYGSVKILDKREINMLSGQLCFFNQQSNYINCRSRTAEKESPPAQDVRAVTVAGPGAPGAGTEPRKTTHPNHPYGLNREQWEAVSSSDPVITVIAGPGTGKTKTLVSRIVYLVERCRIPPTRIAAVTFTNKAAGEMRSRLEKQFGNKRTAGKMTIGTFHSISLQILSQWMGKEKIAIIDQYNALTIIEDIIKKLKLKVSPHDALRRISLLKNGSAVPEEQKSVEFPSIIYDLYCAQLQRYGVMDFDDILREVLAQFENEQTGAHFDQRREDAFSYLLVDEFQDINEIQYRLIKEWGRKSESIFIIGDPDQAIYGFRGSDYRYFDRFKASFPGLKKIELTRHYRSTPQIITCARELIVRKAGGGKSSCLEPTRENGARVRLIETKGEFAEALFVTKEINRMVGGIDMLDTQRMSGPGRKKSPTKHLRGFSDIAVLYRTNRQAAMLEQCFLQEGIQYVVAGRDEFLAEHLVRKTMAFFRFLLNPADLAALMFWFKAENIASPDRLQTILESYLAGTKKVSALLKIIEKTELESTGSAQAAGLIKMLQQYQAMIKKEKPATIIECWIKDNKLSGIRCMELLLNTAVLHQRMSSFVQNLLLGRESDLVRSSSKVYSSDALSLMTIHAAKGLEFPVVFICGVNEGVIPLKSNKADFDPDEERRLFYVGLTRAQDELILLTSRTPSRFITDLSAGQLLQEKAFTPKQAPQYKQVSLFD
ncbi:MAG: UvrD-helicase domain-containing protein [Halanaerobiales bacterium]|nr:UvrD-helicase domain-containing protein [Halanaerobiales bacterium]